MLVHHRDILGHGGREQEVFDVGEVGRLGIGRATGEGVKVGGGDLELAFEAGDSVLEPMVGATRGGRAGEEDAGVASADDLDGRGGLGEIGRTVVAFLPKVVVGVEIGFVADFEGQHGRGADLERIGGFVGRSFRLVAGEVDAM